MRIRDNVCEVSNTEAVSMPDRQDRHSCCGCDDAGTGRVGAPGIERERTELHTLLQQTDRTITYNVRRNEVLRKQDQRRDENSGLMEGDTREPSSKDTSGVGYL